MTKYLLATMLFTATLLPAQQEGATPTQALVNVESKNPVSPKVSDLTLKVDNRNAPLTSLTQVVPSGAQVALLIDDGLRMSADRQIDDLRTFVQHLPPGIEIFIGYMRNGGVYAAQPFTTDYDAAANALRIPISSAGISGSPYFCLSSFVKQWPVESTAFAGPSAVKARFVMMITNGVDPYNGSVSVLNQDSPNVSAAVADAQRAGVAVYSIYYSDAGIRGGAASMSGQSYLAQLSDGTGGTAYFQGTYSPVSVSPFLTSFRKAIAETYIATFPAPGNKKLVAIKLNTKLPGTKLHAPTLVRPGTMQSSPTQSGNGQ
jgi:hypothetical protein